MNPAFNTKCQSALKIVVLCCLVFPLLASQPSRAASDTTIRIFLPIIVRPAPPPLNLAGHVTLNGVDAAGVFLQLLLYDGHSMSNVASTSTIADGSYLFTVPQLSPGQAYLVEFNNSSAEADGRLNSWDSSVLASDVSGQDFKIGDFDIADVTLVSPAPAATVSLPVTFQWDVRPATPGDSYRLDLDDSSSLCHVSSPPLGYTNTYAVTDMAAGCTRMFKNHYWTVLVTGANGGSGRSFYYYSMTFSDYR